MLSDYGWLFLLLMLIVGYIIIGIFALIGGSV